MTPGENENSPWKALEKSWNFDFLFLYEPCLQFIICFFAPANKEARTRGENQTPVHYAAKNDATSALKMLIKMKCEYRVVEDYKGRTPLHVAAELGMSKGLESQVSLWALNIKSKLLDIVPDRL